MNILEFFQSIIGQVAAIRQLTQAVKASLCGERLISPLLLAPAGTGKTRLAKAFVESVQAVRNCPSLSLKPADFRRLGGTWDELLSHLGNDAYVLFIDEVHELFLPGRTEQFKKLANFIMTALDGTFKGGEIQMGEGFNVNFRAENCSIIVATNYPGKLPDAFRSRFDTIELSLYSEDELMAILHGMLASKGLRANEESLRVAARCGRGTARVLEKMANKLAINIAADGSGKNTVNKADIFQALVDCQYFPLGFHQSEIEVLAAMKTPVTLNVIAASFPKMDSGTLKSLVGYSLGLGIVFKAPGGFQLTDKGRRYFGDCASAKFPVPAL